MTTKERLNKVFINVFGDSSIQIFDAMTAEDIEDWDSLTHINLIVGVEKEFKISFKVQEVNVAKNVGEFLKLIESKL